MLAGAGTVALWVVALLCVLAGFAGTILPALPGAPLVFAGLVLAAWADNFTQVGWPTLIVLALLTVLVLVVDIMATAMGAKRVGASRLAILGAMLGTFVGIFFAIPGIIFGPFVGAVAGEYLARAQLGNAAVVGLGTWLGLIFGTVFKLVLLCMMLGIFVLAYFV